METDEGLLKPPEADTETPADSETKTGTSSTSAFSAVQPEDNATAATDHDQASLTSSLAAASSFESKQSLSHTNSLPGSQNLSPNSGTDPGIARKETVFPKHQSFRIKRNKDGEHGVGPTGSSRWSFGGLAKSVGCGVTAFGSGVVQGTKAMGTGVVQGTKAVGTGVYEGTKVVGTGVVDGTKAVGTGVKAVGSGVIEGTKAVGTGVVEGTKVVASVSKDVTLAAGNKVSVCNILSTG